MLSHRRSAERSSAVATPFCRLLAKSFFVHRFGDKQWKDRRTLLGPGLRHVRSAWRDYEKSGREPLVAAQLLGIGKTTLYRKLKEMAGAAACEAPPLTLAA